MLAMLAMLPALRLCRARIDVLALCVCLCVCGRRGCGGVVGVEIVTEVFDTSWRHLQILVNRCWKLLSDFLEIVFERKNCNVRCHQITYLS